MHRSSSKQLLRGVLLTLALLLGTFVSGAEAATSPSSARVSVPNGSTRYVSMTVTDTDGRWGCPSIGAVVQFRLKTVNSGGFTLDGMRIFDGSGNGASVSLVVHDKGSFEPAIRAQAWRWSSWNNTFNHRLSWSRANINVTVQTPGEPWYCSRSRTLTPRRA